MDDCLEREAPAFRGRGLQLMLTAHSDSRKINEACVCKKGRHLLRSLSLGCLQRKPWIVPGQPSCIALKKTSEPLTLDLHSKISVTSKVPPRTSESKGLGIRNGFSRCRAAEWQPELSSKTDQNAARRDRRIRHFDSNQRAIASEWSALAANLCPFSRLY